MTPPRSKGITGEKLEAAHSGDVGHSRRDGNSQTQAQKSDCDFDLATSTKPYEDGEDRITKISFEKRTSAIQNRVERPGRVECATKTRKVKKSGSNQHSLGNDVTSNRASAAGMQVPACLQLGDETIKAMKNAMRSAPVNVSTVGELNLNWMLHYVNLRCDINFDHHIHFTQIKGSRGEEKRVQALLYWLALDGELRVYQHKAGNCQLCRKPGSTNLITFEPRLPVMFKDLKDLLETLVPDKDHDQVAANLDIDLITKQVEKGVLDVGRLSRWLAKLLKSHCAPMRDESAEAMAEKLENGANNGDLSMLINGLENLFGFLESMKLDVANHQIRTFRYVLIEETVAFQQSHFRKRIEDGRLNLTDAKAWYQELLQRHLSRDRAGFRSNEAFCFEAFVTGLVELCSFLLEDQAVPVTLHYDQARINQLRADVQDLVYLRVCVKVFDDLLSTLRCRILIPALAYSTLQSRILTIADEEMGQSGFVAWADKIDDIAVEITRAAYVASSLPGPPRIPEEAFDQTRYLLQCNFEKHHRDMEEQLLSQLVVETMHHAADFQKMSTLAMSEAQKQHQQNRQRPTHLIPPPDLESMARMLAHIGVLHWQVWRDLAYMQDIDDMSTVEEGEVVQERVFEATVDKEEGSGSRSRHESVIDVGDFQKAKKIDVRKGNLKKS